VSEGYPPATAAAPEASDTVTPDTQGTTKTVQLKQLCYARSGDKGDTCNIGLVARSPLVYDWLRSFMQPGKVKEFFEGICKGDVVRHEVPNLNALNFLLHSSLGGGGTVSLRIDPQGKTLAESLLTMKVQAPAAVVESVRQSEP
jgi:hypothetical protein